VSEDIIDYLAEAKENAAAAAKAAQALLPLAGKTDEAIRRLAVLEGALRDVDLSTIGRATSDSRAAAETITVAATSLAAETASLRTRRPRDYATMVGVMGAMGMVFLAVGLAIGTRHADDQVAAATAAVRAENADAIAAAKAEATWAGTPIAVRAQKLDQAGQLNMLTTCIGPNLKPGKNQGRDTCLVQPGFIGWYLD
jgi:hypothetical protein